MYLSSGGKILGKISLVVFYLMTLFLLPVFIQSWAFTGIYVINFGIFMLIQYHTYYIKFEKGIFFTENAFLKTQVFECDDFKEITSWHPFINVYKIHFKNGKTFYFLGNCNTTEFQC